MQYDELGAIAFILVGFADGSMYKVDIKTWSNMKEIFGRKNIKKEELEQMNPKNIKSKKGVYDFLEIM